MDSLKRLSILLLFFFFIILYVNNNNHHVFVDSSALSSPPPPPPEPAHPCIERQPTPIKLPLQTSHLVDNEQEQPAAAKVVLEVSSSDDNGNGDGGNDNIPSLRSFPIKVIDIVPKNEGDDKTPYQLSGTQPIIVAFNRPIIALGEPSTYFPFKLSCKGSDTPVPAGSYRWVTTSIARFDVLVNGWPSDLQCQFSVDETLKSYDGLAISSVPPPIAYYTASPSLSITSITSNRSSEMTNGEWTTYTPARRVDEQDYKDNYEVPPDAVIKLYISSLFEIDRVKEAMRVYQYESKNAAVLKITYLTGEGCGEKEVCITLGSQLEVNPYSTYVIEIPQGIRIHNSSGPLSEAISVKVNGLYPFNFYFIESEATHHRQRLYVRHSLMPSVTEEDLAQVFSLKPSLDLKVSIITPTVIELEAKLKPSTTYKLIVSPPKNKPILDGWNLPLLAQTHTFNMSIGNNYIAYARSPIFDSTISFPNQSMIFYQNLLETKKSFLTYNPNKPCSNVDFKMYAYPITKNNIIGVLKTLEDSSRKPFIIPSQSQQSIPLIVDSNNTVYTAKIDNVAAFKPSGSYLQIRTDYSYDCTAIYSSELVQATQLGVTRLDIGNEIIYWIFLLKDASNVANATVYGYGLKQGDYNVDNLQLIGKSISDKKGLVTFNLAGFRLNWIVVEYGGKLFTYRSNTYGPYGTSPRINSQIITDRKLYNAGDTIHLKAYLNGPKDIILDLIFKISVQWTILGTLQTFDKVVDFDDVYNSLNISIPIPPGTNYGYYSLSISGSSVTDKSSNNFYSNTDVLIADPRIPTGILEISTKDDYIKYDEDSKITVYVSTTNYIGEPSNGQMVKLGWKLIGDPSQTEQVSVTTSKDGNASYTFSFPSAKYDIKSQIEFSAFYIDPTRATVMSNTFERFVLVDPYDIEITLVAFSSQSSKVPYIPQGLNARMYYVPTGETIENVALTVQLTHWEILALSVTEKNADSADRKRKNGKKNRHYHQDNNKQSNVLCTIQSEKREQYDDARFPQCTFTFEDFVENVIVVRGIEPKTKQVVVQTLEIEDRQDHYVYYGYSPNNIITESNHDLKLFTNDNNHYVGDKVVITYWNPFKEARALFYWGCDSKTTNDQFKVGYGFNNYTIKVVPKCQTLGMFAVISIQGHEVGYKIGAGTVSQVYDPLSAKSASGSINLNVKVQPILNLSVSLESEIVSPDSETTITLHVDQLDNGKPFQDQVEACVMVVDKRVLDLVPSQLPDSQSFSMYAHSFVSYDQSTKGLTRSYAKQAEILLRRFKIDQWISDWSGFEVEDPAFFKNLFNYLTNMANPYRHRYYASYGGTTGGGIVNLEAADTGIPMSFDAIAAKSRGPPAPDAGSGGKTDNSKTSLRNNFQTTPLFASKVLIKGGKGQVTFRLPDDITTFQVRAFVVSKSTDYLYSTETSLTSRKDVNILPIIPRFVRIGDTFNLGASIVISNPKLTQSGIMRLVVKVVDPSVAESTEGYSKIVALSSNGTTINSLFNFKALKKGTVDLGLFVYLDNRLLDSIEVQFDVLGRQLSMYVGTSMAVSSNTTVEEGINLPDTEPGTGQLNMVVGVGRYPSVETMCNKLLSIGNDRTPSSVDQLSKQVTYASLTSYNANTTLINEAQAQLKVVMLGFDRYVSGNIKWYPTDVTGSFYPTLYALQLRNLMKGLKHIDGWVLLDAHFSDWQRFIDTYVNELVTTAHQGNHTVDKSLIGLASIALGYYWAPSNDELIELYSFNALSANISDNCDLQCQSYFMIATLLNGDGDQSSFIPTVIQNLENAIRIQGRTAYVTGGGGRSSLSLTIYASISFIMAKHMDTPFLEKMVNFIASGGVVPSITFDKWVPGVSSEQMALSIIAMTCYDLAKNSTQPNLTFSAYKNSVNNLLLSQSFNTTSPKNIQKIIQFDGLVSGNNNSNNSGKLLFSVVGVGEVSVAVGIEYVPTKLPDKPVYNGFYVEKVIKFMNTNSSSSSSNSQSSTTFKYGDYVEVVISVTTHDDVGVIYVEDPLPSVIEPLDNNIYQNPDTPPQWDTVRYYWYSPFGYRETRKDKVIFQGTDILAGSYTVSYFAVVTSSFGVYSLPPTKVYSPNQPELFGLSNGSIISIH